jgi:hypothetical protein
MRFTGLIPLFLFLFLLAGCRAASAALTAEPSPTSTAEAVAIVTPTPVEEEPVDSSPAPELEAIPPPASRRLWAGELLLAADVDDIPAIFAEDDIFVNVEDGNKEWSDEEMVIGLALNGDVRAYPVRLLSLHEIVNDSVGGQAVAITWCPLCFSAIVFDRVVDGKELTFGVSGLLYFNNLVMYDHRTNTLWSQMLGEGIKGAYRRERLAILPSAMTSWGDWKSSHPDTRVLSAVQMGNNAEVIDPYVGYYSSGAAGVTGWANPNELLGPKELVIGIAIDDVARGYPLQLIREQKVVNDVLNNIPLLFAYDEAQDAALIYRAQVADQFLSFVPAVGDETLTDEQTGSTWEIGTGLAIDGPLVGERLARLAGPLVFWFAWSDIHTNSDVYEAGGNSGSQS